MGASTKSFRTDHTLDALGRVVTTTNQGPDGIFGNGDDLDVEYVYDGVRKGVRKIFAED